MLEWMGKCCGVVFKNLWKINFFLIAREKKGISNNIVSHRGQTCPFAWFCLGYACSEAVQHISELMPTSLQPTKRQSASWIRIWLCFHSCLYVRGIIVSVQRFISSLNIRGVWCTASVFGMLAVQVCQGDKAIALFLITQKAEFSKLKVVWSSFCLSTWQEGINSFVILLQELLSQKENAS